MGYVLYLNNSVLKTTMKVLQTKTKNKQKTHLLNFKIAIFSMHYFV